LFDSDSNVVLSTNLDSSIIHDDILDGDINVQYFFVFIDN